MTKTERLIRTRIIWVSMVKDLFHLEKDISNCYDSCFFYVHTPKTFKIMLPQVEFENSKSGESLTYVATGELILSGIQTL